MQDYHLYEYTVIRLMPRVERGEFINIGTILYCSGQKFLECRFHFDENRILSLFPEVDLPLIRQYAQTFECICEGPERGGAIGQLSLAERFRWLTATRSTMIQGAPVHDGYTKDARATLERLQVEMVL